jgi:sugar lactone lactonase YvrE
MRPTSRFATAWALAALLAATLSPSPLAGRSQFPGFLPFSTALGEFPEGVAVDGRGNVYVSFDTPRGEVRRFSPDGSMDQVIDLGGSGALGLATDATGNVYVAREGAQHGVYRIAPSGTVSLVPGTERILFPNGLAFDHQGNLYISESFSLDEPLQDYPGCDIGFGSNFGPGGIWRVRPGADAELLIRDQLLTGVCAPSPIPFPVGANGIAYRHGALYVNNTEKAFVVRIALDHESNATATVFAAIPDIDPPSPFGPPNLDGLTVDVHGNLYLAVINQSRVVRVSADGAVVETVATAADGLDFPASLAFGSGRGARQTVFVTNYAIGPPGGAGPGIVTLSVGVPGLPLR